MRKLVPAVCWAVVVVACLANSAWAQNFDYRRTLTATSNSASALTDYQVKVQLTTGNFTYANALAGGTDIRFTTDPTGAVLDLDYFIEAYNAGGTTDIWVKLPSIPAAGTVDFYMFYGDATLTVSTSSFANTFPNAFVSSGSTTLTGAQVADWFEIQAAHTITVGQGQILSVNARVVRIAGTIDAQGQGSLGGIPGPNVGNGTGGGGTSSNAGSGGGSYGGVGGTGGFDGGDVPGSGGPVYGTQNGTTIEMGSGGGASDLSAGGNGGGGVSLTGIDVTISGSINANGNEGQQPGSGRGGGGGSGGGILIHGYDLNVSGTFSANGATGSIGTIAANDDGGGGGGGRIKVLHENSTINTATLTVSGGSVGPNGGTPPTPGAIGTTFINPAAIADRAILTTFGAETPAGGLGPLPNFSATVNGAALASGSTLNVAVGTTLASLNIIIAVSNSTNTTGTVTNVTSQGILDAEFSMSGAGGPYNLTPTTGTFSLPAIHVVTVTPSSIPPTPFTFTIIVGPVLELSRGGNAITNGGTDDVGTVADGIGHTFDFTIDSTGADPLTLGGTPTVAVTGTTNCQALVVAAPSTPVAAGNSTTFTVYVAASAGAFSADFSIATDSYQNPFTFTLTGTATASPDIEVTTPIGRAAPHYSVFDAGVLATGVTNTRTFTIENQGTATLTLTGATPVTVIGASGATVTVVQPAGGAIGVGNSQTFDLQIDVTSTPISFAVEIASDDPNESPYRFAVTAVAVANGAGEIEIEFDGQGRVANNATVDAGKLALAGRNISFTVFNIGSNDLAITDFATANATNCTATITTVGSSPMTSGSSQIVTVNVVPTAAGALSFSLQLTTDDADENPAVVNVTGTATAATEPFIVVSRAGAGAVAFNGTDSLGTAAANTIPAGTALLLRYTVTNSGTGTLTLNVPVLTSNTSNCTAAIALQPSAVSIAPGATATFDLRITPATAAVFSAMVTIESDDPARDPFTFTVTGNLGGNGGGGGGITKKSGCGVVPFADATTAGNVSAFVLLLLVALLVGIRRWRF